MKNIKTIILAMSFMAVGFSVNFFVPNANPTSVVEVLQDSRVEELESQIKKIKDQEDADNRMGQYAINMMYRSYEGRKLSDGKKLVLARAIVRVTNEIFELEEHKKAFIAAVAIESQFVRTAQSPTGPKGYAQLARASFHEAMAACGVKNVNDDDVWETDLNLYAGACYFRLMLELPEVAGDPFIAIVAYNQGPASKDLKTYAKNGSLDGLEPLKYVAKFAFLKRTTTDTKVKGVPAIGDLPSPNPSGLKVSSENDIMDAAKNK